MTLVQPRLESQKASREGADLRWPVVATCSTSHSKGGSQFLCVLQSLQKLVQLNTLETLPESSEALNAFLKPWKDYISIQ